MKKWRLVGLILAVGFGIMIVCKAGIWNPDNNEKKTEKCIVYFNPTIPLEIKSQSVISEIQQWIHELDLVEDEGEFTSEGSVTVEFYQNGTIDQSITISGEYVSIDSCRYKGKKEELLSFIDFLEDSIETF